MKRINSNQRFYFDPKVIKSQKSDSDPNHSKSDKNRIILLIIQFSRK